MTAPNRKKVERRRACVGEKYFDDKGFCKIMAVVDGYILARRPGCYPFVDWENSFLERWEKVEGCVIPAGRKG